MKKYLILLVVFLTGCNTTPISRTYNISNLEKSELATITSVVPKRFSFSLHDVALTSLFSKIEDKEGKVVVEYIPKSSDYLSLLPSGFSTLTPMEQQRIVDQKKNFSQVGITNVHLEPGIYKFSIRCLNDVILSEITLIKIVETGKNYQLRCAVATTGPGLLGIKLAKSLTAFIEEISVTPNNN